MTDLPNDRLKLTYEQAIAEVERIIERIESGEAGLEGTLDQYERAVKLIGHCREVLNRVEKRLAELTTNAEGRVVIEAELDDNHVGEDPLPPEGATGASGEEGA
jgi:exodeoxyribonuclease VII small subunit